MFIWVLQLLVEDQQNRKNVTFTWVPKNTDFLYFFTFFFWVSKSWWEHRIIPTMCITILVLGRKITNSELFSVFIPHWNPIPPPWGKAGLCHTSKKFLSCFLIVFSNAWFSFATQGAIFFLMLQCFIVAKNARYTVVENLRKVLHICIHCACFKFFYVYNKRVAKKM